MGCELVIAPKVTSCSMGLLYLVFVFSGQSECEDHHKEDHWNWMHHVHVNLCNLCISFNDGVGEGMYSCWNVLIPKLGWCMVVLHTRITKTFTLSNCKVTCKIYWVWITYMHKRLHANDNIQFLKLWNKGSLNIEMYIYLKHLNHKF